MNKNNSNRSVSPYDVSGMHRVIKSASTSQSSNRSFNPSNSRIISFSTSSSSSRSSNSSSKKK